MKKILPCIVIFSFLIYSCKQEEKIHEIPDEFVPYVDEFFIEAQARGRDMKLDDYDLTIVFGDFDDPYIAGNCTNYKMTIDEVHWEYMDDYEKRRLVFHEMGHCFLDRKHKNETTAEGTCISIMKTRSDNFDCNINTYSDIWWDYYLDEFFDEGTVLPGWYRNDKGLNSLNVIHNVLDSLITNINGPAYFNMDDLDFSTLGNYKIEMTFKNWNHKYNPAQFFFGGIAFGAGKGYYADYVEIASSSPARTYFTSENFVVNDDLVLSIVKKGNLLDFYVDGNFAHTMEASLKSSNNLQSNYYVSPVKINLTIDQIE